MKRILTIVLSFLTLFSVRAEYNCDKDPWVVQNLQKQAALMVWSDNAFVKSQAFKDSMFVPSQMIDKYLCIFSALYKINPQMMQDYKEYSNMYDLMHITMALKKDLPWVKTLITNQGKKSTGNASFDTFVRNYGLVYKEQVDQPSNVPNTVLVEFSCSRVYTSKIDKDLKQIEGATPYHYSHGDGKPYVGMNWQEQYHSISYYDGNKDTRLYYEVFPDCKVQVLKRSIMENYSIDSFILKNYYKDAEYLASQDLSVKNPNQIVFTPIVEVYEYLNLFNNLYKKYDTLFTTYDPHIKSAPVELTIQVSGSVKWANTYIQSKGGLSGYEIFDRLVDNYDLELIHTQDLQNGSFQLQLRSKHFLDGKQLAKEFSSLKDIQLVQENVVAGIVGNTITRDAITGIFSFNLKQNNTQLQWDIFVVPASIGFEPITIRYEVSPATKIPLKDQVIHRKVASILAFQEMVENPAYLDVPRIPKELVTKYESILNSLYHHNALIFKGQPEWFADLNGVSYNYTRAIRFSMDSRTKLAKQLIKSEGKTSGNKTYDGLFITNGMTFENMFPIDTVVTFLYTSVDPINYSYVFNKLKQMEEIKSFQEEQRPGFDQVCVQLKDGANKFENFTLVVRHVQVHPMPQWTYEIKNKQVRFVKLTYP